MLSYEDVMKVRRLEQNAARLVKLDKNFYDQLRDFIEKEKELQKQEFSMDRAKEFENLKTAVYDVYFMREKKILNQALRQSRTGGADLEHMQPVEKDLFDNLSEFLNRGRSEMDSLFSHKEQPGKRVAEDLNKVSIMLLEDVPSFMGTDLKEYGPFQKESHASLPAPIAELLLSRKAARTE